MGLTETIWHKFRGSIYTSNNALLALSKKILVQFHSFFWFQPASSYYDGSAADFHNESKHVTMLRDYITRCYIERTDQPGEVIQ